MAKKTAGKTAGIGVGYTSVMIIFVMVSLTLLAALSFSASRANSLLSERSRGYMEEYYSAQVNADRTLALINETAYECAAEGVFSWTFEERAALIEGVSVIRGMSGYTVFYRTEINARQAILTELSVPDDPNLSAGDRIFTDVLRRTVGTDSSDTTEKPLNIWDGTF